MMTRPRANLSQEDFPATRAYVQRKLHTEPLWPGDLQAMNEWAQAQRDPVTLQRWCERYLSTEQWRQLKAAVRAARKRRRERRSGDRPVHVTLSHRAWVILSTLASHEGLTLSDWLIARHHDEWLNP